LTGCVVKEGGTKQIMQILKWVKPILQMNHRYTIKLFVQNIVEHV